MALFADDTKLYRRIQCSDDNIILQNDVNKLQLWSKKWSMEFNKAKFKTIHF